MTMSLLEEVSEQHFQQLSERLILSNFTAQQQQSLKDIFALSDFVAQSLIQQPSLVQDIFANNLLESSFDHEQLKAQLHNLLTEVEDELQLHSVLRQFRRKQMVILAWRELTGRCTLSESFATLSFLADQFIVQSLNWLYQLQCKELGTPIGESGQKQTMYVLAMGKLGGKELNFSSDIDLIFTYPERGKTQGGRRVIESPNFFTKLGQRLISALNQITVDGFVFRVDMRLRPFGDSGPLVSTFASLEDYYQSHGREWERYAMVKARVLGDEGQYKHALQQMLWPFVFKRYVDFSAIESLRKMKAMINAEVRRKQLTDNIKLGLGGIREVEFVAQAFQLIHGGRYPELQNKGLQETLAAIQALQLMSTECVTSLLTSYQFLRKLENVLQQIADKQTQILPTDERDKLRVLRVMQFSCWQDFYQQLMSHMDNVHQIFRDVIGEQKDEEDETAKVFNDIWQLQLTEQEMSELLWQQVKQEKVKKTQVEIFANYIIDLKKEVQRRPVGSRGQETLEKLLPKVLAAVCEYALPAQLLTRVQQIILNTMRRTAYLELLNENQGALQQLLKLCSASPRVATQLGRYPILLDELLDPKRLYHPTPLDSYRSELQQFMLRVPEEDLEQQMEALRQFKQMQFLHIATADIAGGIKLTEVSDHLTCLSEALLNYVVQIAWNQITEKFGLPSNVQGTDRKGFAVIAYGKMGGWELGYGSDLDVVFLHESKLTGVTNGERSIDNQLFYFRLAQRIIHLFSTRTNSGVLYEIDMRLRPSGDSGPLVAGISGFYRYLKEDAWTWEHQALVRSRAVLIDAEMADEFTDIRQKILALPREHSELREQVVKMRDKMREHLNKAKAAEFDLKQSPGGMVDIEFIAQYLVLANAHSFPELLTEWSDNLRIFEACKKAQLLSELQVTQLSDAYCFIRNAAHRLSLNNQKRIVADSEFTEQRAVVCEIWQQLLGES